MKRLCPLADIPDGGVTVCAGDYLVSRRGDEVSVVINRCGHQSLDMWGGECTDGWRFSCPHHGVTYDLRDGSIVDSRGFLSLEPLAPVPNTVTDGVVYIRDVL